MDSKVLIIIPTYNESENIRKIIEQILNFNFNLLVIDDNSPDGTGEIAERLKVTQGVIARSPDKVWTTKSKIPFTGQSQLEVIHREKKLGLGTAYIQGFKWAVQNNFDYIFTMDADFSHSPDYLPEFFKKFSEYDLIIGSRYVKNGGVKNWAVLRKLISRCGNFYAKTILGFPVNDSTSGFMGFNRHVLEKINLEEIKSEGYGFLIEMKYRAYKLGYKIFEYPIIFVDRTCGKSKISKNIIWEAFFLVWKLKLGIKQLTKNN